MNIVGKSFINIADIYCLGTQGSQYRDLTMYFNIAILSITVHLRSYIFNIKLESEEIVHFYLTFLKSSVRF